MHPNLVDQLDLPVMQFTRTDGCVATHPGEMDLDTFLDSFLPNQVYLTRMDVISSPFTYVVQAFVGDTFPQNVQVGYPSRRMLLLRDRNIPADYVPRIVLDLLVRDNDHPSGWHIGLRTSFWMSR